VTTSTALAALTITVQCRRFADKIAGALQGALNNALHNTNVSVPGGLNICAA
jgi:hypothetical protein